MKEISVIPGTTKQRTRLFRDSLNMSLDYEKLSLMDSWVELCFKICKFVLLLLAVFLAGPILNDFEIPLVFLSSIVAIFITLIFEIGYKYAVIKKALDIRVHLVVFSIYALWFGFLDVLAILMGGFVPSDQKLIAGTLYAILVILGTRFLWRRDFSFISRKIEQIVSDEMKPFTSVITQLSLRFVKKARLTSQQVCILILIIVLIFINPFGLMPYIEPWISWMIIGTVVFLVVDFIRFDTFLNSLDLIWEFGPKKEATDIMSFCQYLEKRLQKLKIAKYEIKFDLEPCRYRFELEEHLLIEQVICSFIFKPENYDFVVVLSLASKKPNPVKVMLALGEEWTDGYRTEIHTLEMLDSEKVILGATPLFVVFGDRILIDESILERDVVAWVSGSPCFGVIFESKELLKLTNRTADLV